MSAHNPFVLFDKRLLEQHIQMGHAYYVRQTYPRGMDPAKEDMKAAFLVSHYKDESLAKIHYAALANDGNRFLYRLSEAAHYKKLETATMQPKGYAIFAPILATKEWRPPANLQVKIKKYLDKELPITPTKKESIRTELFLQFGELFITLQFAKEQIKLPLSVIENS